MAGRHGRRDDRPFAALVLLLLLALRRNELLGPRWEDVDLDAGVLRVRQGLHRLDHEPPFSEPKTARSRGSVPLPGLCIDALRRQAKRQEAQRDDAWVWTDSGVVFVTAIDPRNFSRLFPP